jgi:flagellar biosynthesis/type III secretory pathway M-ring protein FliF/YscJ
MPAWVWVLIAIAAVLVCLGIAWRALAARRRRGLKETFGPEYERTVADAPTRREAEAELAERQKRREELDVEPLSPEARKRYSAEWHRVQEHFVDDPGEAVGEADRLIQEVMRERGYPVEGFE